MNSTSEVFHNRQQVTWSTLSSNMKILVEEMARAAKIPVALPNIDGKRSFFHAIQERHCNLEGSYNGDFWEPAINHLKSFEDWEFMLINNPPGYKEYLKSIGYDDDNARKQARVYENAHDIAQIILQHSDSFEWEKTCALQQMVCDMWNTFVESTEFCTTSHCLPPIAKWAVDEMGPWSLSQHCVKKEDRISLRGINHPVPIVSFPLHYSSKGILSWPVLAHEIAHTILETNSKAKIILSDAIKEGLEFDLSLYPKEIKDFWVEYWGSRLSEIGADVMAVLYMGPAAALSLIAYLKAHRGQVLSNEIILKDPHPADTLRGLLVAHAVSFLNISDPAKATWVNYLLHEVQKDFDKLDWELANICARRVAYIVMHTPIIDGKSLKDIKCWDNEDESLISYYLDGRNVQDELIHYRAPHIIASANLYLLMDVQLQDSNDVRIDRIFKQMINNLYEGCSAPLEEKNSYSITKVKKPKKKNKINPVEATAIGVGGLALVGIGILGFLAWRESRK
ncbi:hypothetical protein [Candidatus Protochlamydia amoebophila]|uniref:Uncharacterized protein n=1 Tax=Protochlamydia amoebophila (strain UWE25) TaxID=264201 RepID=Q6M9V1_PARUW|nr:hypothetical protein [Candidatus Protochlamydia amoebophila]CAF24648.1 unnamed protein product [Candidatus Protochlamydia amoebophila UWE25]